MHSEREEVGPGFFEGGYGSVPLSLSKQGRSLLHRKPKECRSRSTEGEEEGGSDSFSRGGSLPPLYCTREDSRGEGGCSSTRQRKETVRGKEKQLSPSSKGIARSFRFWGEAGEEVALIREGEKLRPPEQGRGKNYRGRNDPSVVKEGENLSAEKTSVKKKVYRTKGAHAISN